jgi:hypothetical protein
MAGTYCIAGVRHNVLAIWVGSFTHRRETQPRAAAFLLVGGLL